EALLRIFCKRDLHYLLNSGRNRWSLLSQGWWWSKHVLSTQLRKRPTKRAISTHPFINNNPQCILIARWTWLPLDLFGRHICNGTHNILRTLVTRTLSDQGNAKVTEQNIIVSPQEHVLWFHVTVNELFIMCML